MGYDGKLWSKGTMDLSIIEGYAIEGHEERGISQRVAKKYGMRVEYNSKREPVAYFYPYYRDGKIVAYKVRELPKTFRAEGKLKDVELFGQNEFPGGGKMLVITEGEVDCLSVAEANVKNGGKIFPTVSIPYGAKASVKSIIENRDWIRSFERVVLIFDNDEPGREGIQLIAQAVGADKAYVADLGSAKDANESLMADGGVRLTKAVWGAQRWSPAGIKGEDEIWKAFKGRAELPSSPYPKCMPHLNAMLEGKRPNEIFLLVSGTGAGKSTIMKEIILGERFDRPKDMGKPKIGICSLEEPVGKTAADLMKMHGGIDTKDLTKKKQKKVFNKIFKDEHFLMLDHQGSCGDTSLLAKMECLCLMGCTTLILDHITIAVSEGINGIQGNEAIDKFMSDLLKLAQAYPVWIGVISHLRKSPTGGKAFEAGAMPSLDDIKGSGSIKQICYDIVAVTRNAEADEPRIRNQIEMRVLKARETGRLGPAGWLYYNEETYRIESLDDCDVIDPEDPAAFAAQDHKDDGRLEPRRVVKVKA